MQNNTLVREVITSFDGEKILMGIDPESMGFVMGILTDLYSDQELACLREYSTNAFDAHVEAGISRPIEVTLPSPLSPFLKIRDYGAGLDTEDIRNIYSRYGTSTKRQSDDFVGMLGLGCKSALSYTDSFTVVSVKNGICTQVVISLDEDGSGSMKIVCEPYQTDQESGVEVSIPVNKYNSFTPKAKEFFQYWTPGTVLVNGEQPEPIEGTWIADDLLVVSGNGRGKIVMGNVAYPWDNWGLVNGHSVVAFVKIGEVNFVPSREALMENALTKAAIERIKGRVVAEKDPALLKMVEGATSYAEALRLAQKANTLGLKVAPMYKGQEVPVSMSAKDGHKFVVVSKNKPYRTKGWSADRTVGAKVWSEAIWLQGYDKDSFTPYKRAKLEQWMEQTSNDAEYFILTDKVQPSKWIDKKRIKNWADIEAQKIVREQVKRRDGRPSGSYEGYVAGTYKSVLLATEIDLTKPLFYMLKNAYKEDSGLIQRIYPEATTILLGANREAKFLRDFPQAKRVHDETQKLVNDFKESLTEKDIKSLYIETSRYGLYLSYLDEARIEDPELKDLVFVARNKNKDLLERYATYSKYLGSTNFRVQDPFEKYPLLNMGLLYDKMLHEHIYLYLNAVYSAGQETN